MSPLYHRILTGKLLHHTVKTGGAAANKLMHECCCGGNPCNGCDPGLADKYVVTLDGLVSKEWVNGIWEDRSAMNGVGYTVEWDATEYWRKCGWKCIIDPLPGNWTQYGDPISGQATLWLYYLNSVWKVQLHQDVTGHHHIADWKISGTVDPCDPTSAPYEFLSGNPEESESTAVITK